MSATIEWIIEWMQCYPQADGHTDVVISAGWRCNGAQTAGTPPVDYASTVYGTCSFTLDPSAPFTPYADLTQDQVLGWVYDALGDQKAEIEAGLTAKVEKQLNPITANGLPWAA